MGIPRTNPATSSTFANSSTSTGVPRDTSGTNSNTATTGSSTSADVGKVPGALDWTKIQGETAAGNVARNNQYLASAAAAPVTPPQQANQAWMMALSGLGSIGPMLASLIPKGNNTGNGNSNSNKPPNQQNQLLAQRPPEGKLPGELTTEKPTEAPKPPVEAKT